MLLDAEPRRIHRSPAPKRSVPPDVRGGTREPALALGACLGGNGTLIGASANVVIADIARKAGHPITYRQFFVIGLPVMIGSLLLSTVYIWLLFFW